MTIAVEPNAMNAAFGSAVNERMAADTRAVNRASSLVAAKAAMWRFGGVSAVILATGVAVGAGLYGYSFVNDNRRAAEKMADAMAKALEKTTLKTTGDVKLDPEAKVKLTETTLDGKVVLDPNASIRLDANGAVVRLDPNSTVRVTGIPDQIVASVPRPTQEQLRPEVSTSNNAKVVTNFTVFKQVEFGKGRVNTGWEFESSEQIMPSKQFCYYIEGLDEEKQANILINLARNGVMLPVNPEAKFNFASAAANCIWWDQQPTRRASLETPPQRPAPPPVAKRQPRPGVIDPRQSGPGDRAGNPIIPNSGGKTF